MTGDRIIVYDNNKCVSYDSELYQIFCGYFSKTISGLEVPNISENTSKVTDIIDCIFTVINML